MSQLLRLVNLPGPESFLCMGRSLSRSHKGTHRFTRFPAMASRFVLVQGELQAGGRGPVPGDRAPMPAQSEVFHMLERRLPGLKTARHYFPSAIMLLLMVGLIPLTPPVYPILCLVAAVVSVLSVRGLMRDTQCVQEQKTDLNAQLIQSQKLAAIGELSSGIAHEINNPLAIIGQEAEWIRHVASEMAAGAELTVSDMQDSLQEIARQVERCRDITHKLLDFARKKEPLIQAVDLNRLVEDMVRLVEREAGQHNVVIERRYQPDVPPVRTDGPLVRQVVLNILNNATYAIERDGTITVATHDVGEGAADVVISDTGRGIPREDLNKIFDPFFTTKPPGKGTGLGLSICHGIITRLGGRIDVESEVGKGTRFTIHLPGVKE